MRGGQTSSRARRRGVVFWNHSDASVASADVIGPEGCCRLLTGIALHTADCGPRAFLLF
jgi:hypothetical protein